MEGVELALKKVTKNYYQGVFNETPPLRTPAQGRPPGEARKTGSKSQGRPISGLPVVPFYLRLVTKRLSAHRSSGNRSERGRLRIIVGEVSAWGR